MAKQSSVPRCEVMCCTIINYSKQNHPRATKTRYTKLWGDHPQHSSVSVRCFISKPPAPRASSSKRYHLRAGGFAALGMLERPFERCGALSGLQNRRQVTGKRHPGADTCAVEACEMPDTLGGCDLFSFQLLNQADRSSL